LGCNLVMPLSNPSIESMLMSSMETTIRGR
jgi:hypothetical protein